MDDLLEHYSHERFMRMALREATHALNAGDIPVGAVVVFDGEAVSLGRNAHETRRNDLAHAEHDAISKIPEFLWTHRRQCTVYTTLEPCAMCLGSIVYSSVDRIVYGARDPLCATEATFLCTPYYSRKRLMLVGGVLEEQCQALLNAYHAKTPVRPYLYRPV